MVLKVVAMEDEPNLALASRNKGKGKYGPISRGEVGSGSRPKKYMSKIKCYVYGEFGNYAT